MSGVDAPGGAPPPEVPGDGPPPFLGSWRNVYLALIIVQALIIGGLALMTALLSP